MESATLEEELIVRELQEGDFPILTGETEPWGIKEARGFLEWFTGFHSENRLSRVAAVHGKIVGFYVNAPCRLKVGRKIVPVFRGGLGVHPAYRSKPYNVFTSLVRAVHEESRKIGGSIYSFPIQKLVRYYTRRVGFRSMKTVPRYVRGLGLFFRLGLSRGSVAVRQIDSFGKEFDPFWEAASQEQEVLIARDQEYLNWRHCKEPGKENILFCAEIEGKVAGYGVVRVVVRNGIRWGWVMDLLDLKQRRVTESLLLEAMKYLRGRGVARMECCISGDHYENTLKSLGFIRQDDPIHDALLLVKLYSLELEPEDFYDPAKWFITKADMLHS